MASTTLPETLEKLAVSRGDATDLTVKLESTEFTTLKTHEKLGRVLLASKDVNLGCALIREAPVMVWATDDWASYLKAFESIPEVSRRGVLDMFYPALDSSWTIQSLVQTARRLQPSSSLPVNTIHKLLAIANTNAHEYYGTVSSEFSETLTPGGMAYRSSRSALFLYGSKVAHDCKPNTSYSSKTSDGKLEYKVIRPIRAGDSVTFSYLDKLYETPTHLRRQKLLVSHSFVCKCERCMGPDYSRQISCQNSGCDLFIKCTDDGSGGSSVWKCECDRCPSTNTNAIVKLEAAALQRINRLEQTAMGNCMEAQLSPLENEIKRASEMFSPTHFLTLQARESYARLSASKAAQLESLPARGFPPSVVSQVKKKFGTAEQHRLAAAKMGLAVASACECSAVGCSGCIAEDESKHDAVYETTQTVFFSSQDLIKCSQRRWPIYAIRMIKRYIPMMRIMYGKTDTDVRVIEQTVASFKVSDVDAPASVPAISQEDAKPASSSGSSKKKKGRKNNKKKKNHGH